MLHKRNITGMHRPSIGMTLLLRRGVEDESKQVNAPSASSDSRALRAPAVLVVTCYIGATQ